MLAASSLENGALSPREWMGLPRSRTEWGRANVPRPDGTNRAQKGGRTEEEGDEEQGAEEGEERRGVSRGIEATNRGEMREKT